MHRVYISVYLSTSVPVLLAPSGLSDGVERSALNTIAAETLFEVKTYPVMSNSSQSKQHTETANRQESRRNKSRIRRRIQATEGQVCSEGVVGENNKDTVGTLEATRNGFYEGPAAPPAPGRFGGVGGESNGIARRPATGAAAGDPGRAASPSRRNADEKAEKPSPSRSGRDGPPGRTARNVRNGAPAGRPMASGRFSENYGATRYNKMRRRTVSRNGPRQHNNQTGERAQYPGSLLSMCLPVAVLEVRGGANVGNRRSWNVRKIISGRGQT